MSQRWNFGMVAKIAMAFADLEKGMPGHRLDFRKREEAPPLTAPFKKQKSPRRSANLRLHLGPSDSGRLMRNRTPQPGPVRLTVHDWWRRENLGTSKRIANMTADEKRSAHTKIDEVRRRG